MHKDKKCAFTLAETLIALAIIGVVSALTIPTVIKNYQKHVVETKLKAFYSTINQALMLYKAKNGSIESLPYCAADCPYSDNFGWLSKHILPYIKYNKVNQCGNRSVCVYMVNGDSFRFDIDANGADLSYCMKCDINIAPNNPRNRFMFQYCKASTVRGKIINSKNFIEPYTYDWNGTIDGLKNNSMFGCKKGNPRYNYCAKYIQLNNWKIPDDYPW